MRKHPFPLLSRRAFLSAAASLSALTLTRRSQAGANPWAQDTLDFIESLRRENGGYAWPNEQRTHLTPSFAAIGCYHVLGAMPPDAMNAVAYLRDNHPFVLKQMARPLKVFEYQQTQGLQWLGADASFVRETLEKWTEPLAYAREYEQHGYPVMGHETMVCVCRKLLGMPMEPVEASYTEYLAARRRPNGSYNNTRTEDGGDGHVMNTYWALWALDSMGRSLESPADTAAWIQACQRPGGGFTYQPEPAFAGVEDVTYTWAAVRGLALCGAAPKDRESCIRSVFALRNADGGFGSRPGWPSEPMATYRALDTLSLLGALERTPPAIASKPTEAPLPEGLRVYSAYIEAHGNGSPAEAVDMARALHIHLWGAKNARPGWLEQAQAIADAQRVPVTFFTANEEYGTWVDVPGLGTYSHTSDLMAPAGAHIEESSLAQAGVVSWEAFRERRLAPLQAADGALVWQFGENEEITRVYMDDSLERAAYACISTFHFGNPDFTNSSPFLMHYQGQIPYTGMHDAHGGESWWWGDMLEGYRTLFLATEPTYKAFRQALARNWVGAARHDAVSSGKTWMHTGNTAVRAFFNGHGDQWQWWDNPKIQRPPVSLVAVRPEDEYEAGRPESGVLVRVRCRWDNTAQGMLKEPRTELVHLEVDGSAVETQLTEEQSRRGISDRYHSYAVTAPGKHEATVTVRDVRSGKESARSIRFTVA